ncbi:hypothetical protein QOZ80_3AG0223150 [Eleusine coracana subsp. coracana]|nr:hypothetical protein QOZ80_3AG0223150 [Eleusine coracana subsp. coracana]
MDAMMRGRTFEDFDPAVQWSRAAEADAVKISLPGFKREEIRVLVDNHGHLRTRGERAVAGTRWARFQKDFKLPDNCNVDGIRAKFESETLTITLPKKTPSPPQVSAAAPVAPVPSRPEPRRPPTAPPQAIPEPARPTVPAAPLVPAAPSQKMPPAPSQRQPAERLPPALPQQRQTAERLPPAFPQQMQPAERRPSLPPRLPSVPTPAEFVEPIKKKAESVAAVVLKLKEEYVKAKKPSFNKEEEEEEKRMEREAMGKMEGDRKMMEANRKMMEEKQEQEAKEAEEAAAAMARQPRPAMARQPRPTAASRGLLVNVAVAVVVLVGITTYVWHTLKNATGGDHGHGRMGAGSYGDEM